MDKMFDKFAMIYGKDADENVLHDCTSDVSFLEKSIKIKVPEIIVKFWSKCGFGYFGNREIYFFSPKAKHPRSIIEWNSEPFWSQIFPPHSAGGPFFFAETCFGDQIGFRYEDENLLFVLLVVDTFDLFVMTDNQSELFSEILPAQDSLFEPNVLHVVKRKLGVIPDGMHYVPIVSPLVGGSNHEDNFLVGPARAHIVDSFNLFSSL